MGVRGEGEPPQPITPHVATAAPCPLPPVLRELQDRTVVYTHTHEEGDTLSHLNLSKEEGISMDPERKTKCVSTLDGTGSFLLEFCTKRNLPWSSSLEPGPLGSIPSPKQKASVGQHFLIRKPAISSSSTTPGPDENPTDSPTLFFGCGSATSPTKV